MTTLPLPPRPVAFMLAALAALSMTALLAVFPIGEADVFMYLAIGRRMVEQGGFVATDPFLYSIPNYRWEVLHEWLLHLAAYWTYEAAGFPGLVLAKAVIVTAMAAGPVVLAWRLGHLSAVVPLSVLVGAWAGSFRFTERASTLGDLFTLFVAAVALLESRRPTRLLYALPVVFLLWANTHPGFLVGLGMLAAALALGWLDEARRRTPAFRKLAACAAASAAACLANPAGIHGVLFPLRAFFDADWAKMHETYLEWEPTFATTGGGKRGAWIAAALLAWTGAHLARSAWRALGTAERRPWLELMFFALTVFFFLKAIRFIALASFMAPMLLASVPMATTSRTSPSAPGAAREAASGKKSRAARATRAEARKAKAEAAAATNSAEWQERAALLLAAMAGMALASYVAVCGYTTSSGFKRHLGLGLDARLVPVDAAETFEVIERERPIGNIFNTHGFGAYLAWRWDGRRKLFYHGFVEEPRLYRDKYLAAFESAEGLQAVLLEYDIDAFFLRNPGRRSREQPSLYEVLDTSPEWRLVHEDWLTLVYVRK